MRVITYSITKTSSRLVWIISFKFSVVDHEYLMGSIIHHRCLAQIIATNPFMAMTLPKQDHLLIEFHHDENELEDSYPQQIHKRSSYATQINQCIYVTRIVFIPETLHLIAMFLIPNHLTTKVYQRLRLMGLQPTVIKPFYNACVSTLYIYLSLQVHSRMCCRCSKLVEPCRSCQRFPKCQWESSSLQPIRLN